MARPKRGNYAYGDAGQARYRKAVREYNEKMKKLREEKTKIDSTKKNIEKQKTANKKAGTTTTKTKTVAKTKTTPTSTAAKGKTLATGKTTSKTKAVETPKTTTATKTRTRTRTQTKSKTTPKKTVTPKKPAGKVPAKKPLISNKNKLRIKKAATTTTDTTKKVVKKGVEQTKKIASNVKKKVNQVKKFVNKESPVKKPTTTGQKLVSGANQGIKKTARGVGRNLKAAGLRIGRGLKRDPKSLLKGAKGAGISYLAEAGTKALINRAFKPKGMTASEYAKKLQEMKNNRNIVRSVKNIAKKVRGNFGESSTTKNINKQKNNNKLKVNKLRGLPTQYSSNAARKKQNFNASTGTKKVDKRFASFREDPTENRKLQDERKKNNNTTETYSRRLSDKAKKTKNTKTTSSGRKMHAIEKRNRKIFGDAHVDRLKAKHAEWKKRRKKK